MIRPIQSTRWRSGQHSFCAGQEGRMVVNNDPDICLITRERRSPAAAPGVKTQPITLPGRRARIRQRPPGRPGTPPTGGFRRFLSKSAVSHPQDRATRRYTDEAERQQPRTPRSSACTRSSPTLFGALETRSARWERCRARPSRNRYGARTHNDIARRCRVPFATCHKVNVAETAGQRQPTEWDGHP
jgi:hypothetical protein